MTSTSSTWIAANGHWKGSRVMGSVTALARVFVVESGVVVRTASGLKLLSPRSLDSITPIAEQPGYEVEVVEDHALQALLEDDAREPLLNGGKRFDARVEVFSTTNGTVLSTNLYLREADSATERRLRLEPANASQLIDHPYAIATLYSKHYHFDLVPRRHEDQLHPLHVTVEEMLSPEPGHHSDYDFHDGDRLALITIDDPHGLDHAPHLDYLGEEVTSDARFAPINLARYPWSRYGHNVPELAQGQPQGLEPSL